MDTKAGKIRISISVILLATALATVFFPSLRPLAPPLVAGGLLFLTRSAVLALLGGSLAGAAFLAKSLLSLPKAWLVDHAWPSLASSWHWSGLLYTILLAAFAAVMEHSGAMAGLLLKWTGGRPDRRKFETGIMGLGLVCFFDGLANAIMLGRVGRTLADRSGVSREKLAYLVDTTSSAVACVAFLSTWSVVQLSLIGDALKDVPATPASYLVFLKSIPLNFYCLLSLLLAFLAARWNWSPPPMNRTRALPVADSLSPKTTLPHPVRTAVIPLAGLLLSVPLSFWIVGNPGKIIPTSVADIQTAFNTSRGPWAMLLAGSTSLLLALLCHPREAGNPAKAMAGGVRAILPALLILLMAWTMGSTMEALGTGKLIASLAGETLSPSWLPAFIFVVACLTSFATGTSWGTMSLLMPIALGSLLALGEGPAIAPLIPAVVAAVFGGAVFGDHASPFSDTTIVSALACDITTSRHVVTQLPYALLAGSTSLLAGYLPLALGLPTPLTLPLAAGMVLFAVWKTRGRFGER